MVFVCFYHTKVTEEKNKILRIYIVGFLKHNIWILSEELYPLVSPKIHWQTISSERVTGRKARGLQMEEIGCKCRIIFS